MDIIIAEAAEWSDAEYDAKLRYLEGCGQQEDIDALKKARAAGKRSTTTPTEKKDS